jgi:hypothetical protein
MAIADAEPRFTDTTRLIRPGLSLPAIDHNHPQPMPSLPEDPDLLAQYNANIEKRAAIIDSKAELRQILDGDAVVMDRPTFSDILEHYYVEGQGVELIAGRLTMDQYAGEEGLITYLFARTNAIAARGDQASIDEAQSIIERTLIASGPERVSVAFSSRIPEAVRKILVKNLGYEPLGTDLANTTDFDVRNGILSEQKLRYGQFIDKSAVPDYIGAVPDETSSPVAVQDYGVTDEAVRPAVKPKDYSVPEAYQSGAQDRKPQINEEV